VYLQVCACMGVCVCVSSVRIRANINYARANDLL